MSSRKAFFVVKKCNKYLTNKINGAPLIMTYVSFFFPSVSSTDHFTSIKTGSRVWRNKRDISNFQCVTKSLKHITMLNICIISFMYHLPSPPLLPLHVPCEFSADEIPSRHYNCKFPFIHEKLPPVCAKVLGPACTIRGVQRFKMLLGFLRCFHSCNVSTNDPLDEPLSIFK